MRSRRRSKHGVNTDEHGEPVWQQWSRMYSNAHAPSWWKRRERRQERTKARQQLKQQGREDIDKYHRPYYW